ncbi:sodium/calcium exchanger 3-like isoform X2 [Lineus longissimus]|uniref:sodium/calcium exchanger 3-like isoform X2 n=1 Tax=Lineus longissimus TaxID=88925 RepID=UPI002B4ED328
MNNCDIIVSNYSCSHLGTFLPLINEYTWAKEVRAALYLLGLLWCFFGVAIVADVFMCAIEKITSKTTTLKMASPESSSGFEEIEIKVWNNTVANLTLMALGSSAPEILMSIFEVIMNDFKAGDLGPGTIVGSAAFNLLVIVGVCIISIPSPEIRSIKQIKVFGVTAFFSVFAYVWLIIVLLVSSPDYVELWEAIVTLLFFPVLVIIAYMVDKDYCAKKKDEEGSMMMTEKRPGASGTIGLSGGKVDADTIRLILKSIGKHPDLSEEDAAKLAAAIASEHESHSRLWYRIQATRSITGSNKLTPALNELLTELYEKAKERQDTAASRVSMASMSSMEVDDLSHGGVRSVIEFAATSVAVMEKDGHVRLTIHRYGRTNNRVIVKFETIDGTAESNSDYVPKKELLVFEKEEVEKKIDIEIIDDNEWEPDEMFFAKIAVDTTSADSNNMVIGRRSVCQVTIIDDDKPGILEFTKPSYLFKESSGKALIPIQRTMGADGRIAVKWATEDMTALNGRDFIGGEGEIVFEHGEVTKMLEIPINDDQEAEKDENFRIILSEPTKGAELGRLKRTVVTIVNDDEFNGIVSRLVNTTNMNLDAMKVDHTTWVEQFQNAMNVNGGDIETASGLDYFLHFVTFAWKIIFALIPPPSIWGGWLCFFISLIFIGILTILIGDLARIFGCLVGLEDAVTAITFVAMGTSLPDLFASKNAATQEKYADNSIGNVTGSNSVNVFLGLGIPWVIAAAYWTAQGKTFYVPAGSVAFTVVLYTICSLLCIGLILLRRYLTVFGKGELGGNNVMKWVSFAFLVTLWVLYVLLSAFNSYKIINVNL